MEMETKDWNEAALLIANGIHLIRVRRDGVCFFVFDDQNRATALVEAYWRGDLAGDIRAFTDAQRRVKDLIHREGSKNGMSYEPAARR